MLVSPAMQTPMPPDAAKEIEQVKSMVARRFPVYDVKVSYDVVQFFCTVDETMLEESFERLREEMAPQGYIPMITYQNGEHVVIVGKKPKTSYRSVYVNLTMLIITLLAMTFAGILDWASYADIPSNEVYSLENIGMGMVVFTLPLFAILAVHELGHFFMARKRKVAASLPFFIPSIPPLGTFGAFISLRDPIPNRKSLLEIGIAGPIAGLLIAIPLGIAGLMLTNIDAKPVPDDFETGSIVRVAFPLMYGWIEQITPIEGDYLLHPTAFAAWVGFLVTALNLLPAGQLDGGHIARAVFGNYAKYVSWATIAVLIALSFFYFAWMFFAILILFIGAKHPPPLNDITKLDSRRRALGLFAFVILIIAFAPVPISVMEADHSVSISPIGDSHAALSPGDSVLLAFSVENLGNVKNNVSVSAGATPQGWTVGFKLNESSSQDYQASAEHRLDVSENVTFDLLVVCGPSPPGEELLTVVVRSMSSPEDERVEHSIEYRFNVTAPSLEFWAIDDALTISVGGEATAIGQVNNTGDVNLTVTLTAYDMPGIGVDLHTGEPDANHTQVLNLTVPANDFVQFSIYVFTSTSAEEGDWIVTVQPTYYDLDLEGMEIHLTLV